MGRLLRKINKFFSIQSEFGFSYSILSGLYRTSKNYEKYISLTCDFIYRENAEIIKKIKPKNTPDLVKRPIIWSFWWQGKKALPDILQTCLASHEKHISSLGYEYIFIDQDNISEYLDIPDIITKKLNKGVISFTHFSDYVRIALIEKYGGAWIDITLLMVNDLDCSVFNYDFYSFKTNISTRKINVIGQMVTDRKWAGFMLCSNQRHSPLFAYLKDALEAYWQRHDKAIDYFLLNMLLRCAYEHNEYVRNVVDLIPFNNPHLYELAPLINIQWNDSEWNQISDKEIFFKVTQKKPAYEKIGEADTFYGHIKKLYR